MIEINIEEIQSEILGYLRRVEAGETLVIVRANQAVAELRPISIPQELRPFGLGAGEFVVPDDFDAPLPEYILNAFERK